VLDLKDKLKLVKTRLKAKSICMNAKIKKNKLTKLIKSFEINVIDYELKPIV
jgi:hypothetical protein